MNLRLLLLDKFVFVVIRTAKIRELFRLTAGAFGVDPPDLAGLDYRELLEAYALFTKAECGKVLGSSGKATEVRERLHQRAFETGVRLKSTLKIGSYGDVLIASRIFYKILGIDFDGTTNGTITIQKCFFSQYFTPETCSLMSALDAGVAEGLSGGPLKFTQRITENRSCCRATLTFSSAKEAFL